MIQAPKKICVNLGHEETTEYGTKILNLPPSSVCSGALQISQRPRFYGVRTNQKQLAIYCLVSPQHLQANVSWYKKAQGSDHKELVHEKTATFKTWNMIGNALIRIQNLRVEDSGVYYCKINNTLGPGTHIEVVSKWLGQQMQHA